MLKKNYKITEKKEKRKGMTKKENKKKWNVDLAQQHSFLSFFFFLLFCSSPSSDRRTEARRTWAAQPARIVLLAHSLARGVLL